MNLSIAYPLVHKKGTQKDKMCVRIIILRPFSMHWHMYCLADVQRRICINETTRNGLKLPIALPLDSLLLHGVSPRPAFRPSRGRTWRRSCLRHRARRQKKGLALTPRNKRLSNGRGMKLPKVNFFGIFEQSFWLFPKVKMFKVWTLDHF